MSKASNQNKRPKQNRSKTSSDATTSRIHPHKVRGRQTRNRQRRADWIRKREENKNNNLDKSKSTKVKSPLRIDSSNSRNVSKLSLKVSPTSKTTNKNPLIRGKLQRVLTKRSGGKSMISEISREATAGGVIYRLDNSGDLEILLVADHFDRWTIPKGHIEDGETAQETAIREIGEEAGVHQLDPICWLGKIHFRYRRENILVLMSTQIYLFKALGDTDDIQKEEWMNGIKWFKYNDAVEIIAYRDIAKLMKLAHRRLVQRGEIDGEEE